jgi:RsiW-degrading membrane proteinase PrsW (M82 family)
MSQYHIDRNNQLHGPYDIRAMQTYLYDGSILLQDRIKKSNGEYSTVREILKENKITPKIKNNGSIVKQIKSFGLGLLFPKSSFSLKTIKSDQRLLIVSIIGLAPAFLIKFTGSSVFTFYPIALYFSVLWGLFFHSVFKTTQVEIKTSIKVFFLVQLIIFTTVFLFRIPDWNPLYKLTSEGNSFISRIIGFTFGVGVFEESVKLISVYLLVRKSKEPLLPQTMVFYGLISGIGFGVFEGVIYQLGVNSQLDYSTSFFLNIARLTSLPFLHAIWSGISSYFLAFSFLYPTNRYSMWVIAIAIPSLLHGLYDTFTWSLPGLFVSYLGVTLLIIYLKKAKEFQNKIVK